LWGCTRAGIRPGGRHATERIVLIIAECGLFSANELAQSENKEELGKREKENRWRRTRVLLGGLGAVLEKIWRLLRHQENIARKGGRSEATRTTDRCF
jgi:hypothetical protein